jgi:hypothetical protein
MVGIRNDTSRQTNRVPQSPLTALVRAALGGGKNPIDALVWVLKNNPGLANQVQKTLSSVLDEAVKHPSFAPQWKQLAEFASKKGAITDLLKSKLSEPLGAKAAGQISHFSERLLRTATTDGFDEAIKFGSKRGLALFELLKKGGVLAKVAKLAKFAPGVGLAISTIGAIRTFGNPNATFQQKAAALLDVAGGVAGLLPGVGTGAQAAMTAVSFVASTAAGDPSKASSSNRAWQPPTRPAST